MNMWTHLTVWEQAARAADFTLELPGGVPMYFRRIPPGSFRMGSRGYSHDEEPIHRVVIEQEYWLGTFVVTQEQWKAVAGQCPELRGQADPSHFKGPRRPVEQVSWYDANTFCEWVTQGLGDQFPEGVRLACLPTEAQWEYACRAGTETEYYSGDGEEALAAVGWYDENAGNETHAVDELAEEHPFGLYGLHGNVWEWCRDVFDAKAYRKREESWVAQEWTLADAGTDAQYWREEDREAGKNQSRVLRGGSWIDTAGDCRSAFRYRNGPDVRLRFFGFRVGLVRGPASGRGAPGTDGAEAGPAPGDGGRGTRPESDGAGAAGAAGVPNLATASFPAKRGR